MASDFTTDPRIKNTDTDTADKQIANARKKNKKTTSYMQLEATL